MAKVVDGRGIASSMIEALREECRLLVESTGAGNPKLVSVVVGESGEALLYLKEQEKCAQSVGITFLAHELEEGIAPQEFLRILKGIALDPDVTGIIIQKPLPNGLDYGDAISVVPPEKDAEGMHPCNLGKLVEGRQGITPCTPSAVMEILKNEKVSLYGSEVVIVGHSQIVGKPLSLMLLNETATTTVCHIATAEKGDIMEHTQNADVLIVAVGKTGLVDAGWVKDGAVVIDVGINSSGGRVSGDVKFDEVEPKASLITPVPGGVGPVTAVVLMRNVLEAYKVQYGKIQG